jgi:hypothetical protein
MAAFGRSDDVNAINRCLTHAHEYAPFREADKSAQRLERDVRLMFAMRSKADIALDGVLRDPLAALFENLRNSFALHSVFVTHVVVETDLYTAYVT